MSKPKAGARGSGVPASRPTQAAGRPVATDGITITRWSLGLSLSIALAVLTGVFTLLWDETTTLGETQVEVASRVSRLDERVAGLDQRVAGLDQRVAGLDQRVSRLDERVAGLDQRVAGLERQVQDFREEVRADMTEFRADIRQLTEIIRARGGPPGP